MAEWTPPLQTLLLVILLTTGMQKYGGFRSIAGIGGLVRSTFDIGTDSRGNRAYINTVVVHVMISVPVNITCMVNHCLGRGFRPVDSTCRNLMWREPPVFWFSRSSENLCSHLSFIRIQIFCSFSFWC